MSEKELVTLVRVSGAAEPGELAHRPEFAAIACRMDTASVRVRSGKTEVELVHPTYVKRSEKRIYFLLRVREGDVARLCLIELCLPVGELGPKTFYLAVFLFRELGSE